MATIQLPAGTTHVRFGDLERLIADARFPATGPDDERFFYYHAARINLDGELKAAVARGVLPVKDALTLGPHPFPHGDALNDALVTIDDLRGFLAGRGVAVVAGEPAAPERTSDEPQDVPPADERSDEQRTAKRRDLLAPLIEAAQRECSGSCDAAAVWPVLVGYAKAPRRPLIGVCDEGIKWIDASDEARYFTLKNLRDRLRNKTKTAR